MKIYPSTHKISAEESGRIDTDLNIPIAYINTDTKYYDISKTVSGGYSTDSMTEIIPGQEFDSITVKAFNKFKEEVDISKYLVRKGDKYVYQPESITFSPQTFLYKATIKKHIKYSISNSYNISCACIDDPDSLDLSQRIAKALINPSDRSMLPANISINNNTQNASSLTTGTMKDTDFLVIESPDGIHYDDTEENGKIDYTLFLDNHVNLWVAVESIDRFDFIDTGIVNDYTITKPIVLKNKVISSKQVFDYNKIVEKSGVMYHKFFDENLSPVVIEEHIGKGFIVYSSNEVTQDPIKYSSLLYEVMIYCFLNSYGSTDNLQEWITDDLPDYHVVNSRLTKKMNFSSAVNMHNYFKLKDSEMTLYNVDIYDNTNRYLKEDSINNNIKYSGISGGHLIFHKSKTITNDLGTRYSVADPDKPRGWKSIYNGSEIIYVESIYYLIEETLEDKVFIEETGDNLLIRISPFKHSLKGLNYQYVTSITVPLFKTDDGEIVKVRSNNYFIYINNDKIEFCDEYEWNNTNGDLMFTVHIKQDSDKTTVFDMRQLGGGLPEDREENFDLLDIGHVNGRPYRKAGTVIITMPTKYKQHEELILEAVKKYISADEYPIILFEDKEE